jgi:hypothetical protein
LFLLIIQIIAAADTTATGPCQTQGGKHTSRRHHQLRLARFSGIRALFS